MRRATMSGAWRCESGWLRQNSRGSSPSARKRVSKCFGRLRFPARARYRARSRQSWPHQFSRGRISGQRDASLDDRREARRGIRGRTGSRSAAGSERMRIGLRLITHRPAICCSANVKLALSAATACVPVSLISSLRRAYNSSGDLPVFGSDIGP